MEKYEDLKKKIDEEIETEWETVYKISEKTGNIKSNDYDVEIGSTLGFGSLAWVATLIALPFILKGGAIPASIIQPLTTIIPLGVGAAATYGLRKKFKNSERLRKTTSARIQVDKTVEATKLDVENAKTKARISVLKSVKDRLKEQGSIEESLPLEFQKVTPAQDTRTQEEFNASIAAINDAMYEKGADIDTLVTKKTLKERFWRVRDKAQKYTDIPLFGLIGLVAGFAIYNIPLLIANATGAYSISPSILQMFIPGIITAAATTGYAVKKYKDEKAAFEKVNKELLGDDALPEFSNDSEFNRKLENNNVERFDLALRPLIGEQAALRVLSEEEQERYAFNFGTASEGDEESILFKDFQRTPITEATRKHVLEHPEQYQSCPPRIRQGMFYTDEEYEQHVQESLARPLPGEDKGIAITKKK